MDTKTITGKEGRTHNSGLAKVAVQCSADTFVVNQSLVLRINICGKNRHLRQAAKRCVQHIFRTGEFNNLMQQMINFIFVELWKNYAGD